MNNTNKNTVKVEMVFLTHLRMRTQVATSEYARSVPIDIISTKAFRSNRNAITAKKENKMQNLCEADILSQDFNLCQQRKFKLFY